MGLDHVSYAPYSTYPSASNGASGSSYATPIDLTASNSPKKCSRKRKNESADGDDADGKPAKKKTKPKDEERRLKRFRAKLPGAYHDIRHRALTQRMFVIDRQRHAPKQEEGSLVEHATETISLAGTTGNIYTIDIDRVPTCDCPHARKGNQCKHLVYVMARVLRVPENLEYQLAYLSSELKQIFEKAPPLPSETVVESEKDGNRKKLEGECPICCVDFEPENAKEQVVYCKAACGNNIHKECFDQWARTKPGKVTCPFCRTPWDADGSDVKNVAKSGAVNAEGYVNVAGQLGLSGQRDHSTYNEYWVRRQGYDSYG
ncbi:hypothetical protein AC579_8820 [Lecanosticta acicola]|uniref:Uncharacterized protein n=1 Tax=Lecanosticta acicola TaxID=111012 RepID=A0AAI8YRP9_9PEZI|nr:hypothetical protein AC579_8820 [Lecanosticta acicola]